MACLSPSPRGSELLAGCRCGASWLRRMDPRLGEGIPPRLGARGSRLPGAVELVRGFKPRPPRGVQIRASVSGGRGGIAGVSRLPVGPEEPGGKGDARGVAEGPPPSTQSPPPSRGAWNEAPSNTRTLTCTKSHTDAHTCIEVHTQIQMQAHRHMYTLTHTKPHIDPHAHTHSHIIASPVTVVG